MILAQVTEWIESAQGMKNAAKNLQRQRMSHIEILRAALEDDCICEGRAQASWALISVHMQALFNLSRVVEQAMSIRSRSWS